MPNLKDLQCIHKLCHEKNVEIICRSSGTRMIIKRDLFHSTDMSSLWDFF